MFPARWAIASNPERGSVSISILSKHRWQRISQNTLSTMTSHTCDPSFVYPDADAVQKPWAEARGYQNAPAPQLNRRLLLLRFAVAGGRGWTEHRERNPSAQATSESQNRPLLLNHALQFRSRTFAPTPAILPLDVRLSKKLSIAEDVSANDKDAVARVVGCLVCRYIIPN